MKEIDKSLVKKDKPKKEKEIVRYSNKELAESVLKGDSRAPIETDKRSSKDLKKVSKLTLEVVKDRILTGKTSPEERLALTVLLRELVQLIMDMDEDYISA